MRQFLHRAAGLEKVGHIVVLWQLEEMHNANGSRPSTMRKRRLFLGMNAACVVIVGQDYNVTARKKFGCCIRQAITAAAKSESGNVFCTESVAVLFALWPKECITRQLAIKRIGWPDVGNVSKYPAFSLASRSRPHCGRDTS